MGGFHAELELQLGLEVDMELELILGAWCRRMHHWLREDIQSRTFRDIFART